jgi:hypothetical protein
MIRKSVQRFSEKIMLNKRLERDDDSKKSHPALASSEEPTARSVRRERESDPETDQEAGNIREGILRDPVADRMADEQIDQRRILDNRDSEASRFGDHLIAGLAASLAADQRHRRFFAMV